MFYYHSHLLVPAMVTYVCLFVTFYFLWVILCLFVVVLISCMSFFFMCIFFVLIVFHFFFLIGLWLFFIHLSESSSSFCALLFLCLSLRYYTICWAMLTLCGL